MNFFLVLENRLFKGPSRTYTVHQWACSAQWNPDKTPATSATRNPWRPDCFPARAKPSFAHVNGRVKSIPEESFASCPTLLSRNGEETEGIELLYHRHFPIFSHAHHGITSLCNLYLPDFYHRKRSDTRRRLNSSVELDETVSGTYLYLYR